MAAGEEEQEAGIPEWVVTFGDMMSLLLTFFVMLLSMSEIKQDQSVALVESLRRQFGYSRSRQSMMPGRFAPTSASLNRLPSLGRARRMNTMSGGDKVKAPQGDYARVMAIRPSDNSTLGGVVYFDEGSSELTDNHQETLRQAALAISGKPQKIEIRGHTSSRPLDPDSPYRNHTDLAYARGFKVREFLTGLGVNPKRMSIHAAGANEPIHTGYDELLRKKNDRVEVLLLDEMAEDLPAAKRKEKEPQKPEPNSSP